MSEDVGIKANLKKIYCKYLEDLIQKRETNEEIFID